MVSLLASEFNHQDKERVLSQERERDNPFGCDDNVAVLGPAQ